MQLGPNDIQVLLFLHRFVMDFTVTWLKPGAKLVILEYIRPLE